MDSDDEESGSVSPVEHVGSSSSVELKDKSSDEKNKTEGKRSQKQRQDLDMYAKFFPELFELQVLSNCKIIPCL